MVIFGKWQGQAITISQKPSSFTISLQREKESTVYSFDGEGRLWTAMVAGISYRRGLNGKTVAKWETPTSPGQAGRLTRERKWLEPGEADRLEEAARRMSEALYRDISGKQAALSRPLSSEGQNSFERVLSFDQKRYSEDVARYHQVYQPVGILPPDQYMAVVLQATLGCSFNTCTFCNFYRDRRFRIRKTDEFRVHAEAVRTFLGEGLYLRRTIFLGDANALVTPTQRLVELFDVVRDLYDVERLGGIYAFLDGFSGEKKTREDYLELSKRGLKRVYVGMESGNADLLKFLKKPGKPEDAIQAVHAMKASGILVGVIVLLGAGGKKYAAGHVQDTIQALNEMQLGIDDLIYFSELVESEGLEYSRDAYQQQLEPLSGEERMAQGQEIETSLTFTEERGEPHISRYDIREFVY